MKNINKKTNALIKRRNLIALIKDKGIKRISPGAIILFEDKIKDIVDKTAGQLKEEISINGRKTAKKEDIIKIFSKEEKELGFEV